MGSGKILVLMMTVAFLVGGWFVVRAGVEVWSWSRLTGEAGGRVESWEVEEVGMDRYLVRALFSYRVSQKLYEGEGMIPTREFRNRLAAERYGEEMSLEGWRVFFRPRRPEVSALRRSFPFKRCFYAAILCGVGIYFVVLGRYARRARSVGTES